MAQRATPEKDPADGRSRVVIERVDPEIDCGAFPAKTIVDDPFVVEADAFTDGHDLIRCMLLYRKERQRRWRELEMEPLGNDRWRGSFVPDELGRYVYTLQAWVDPFGTWRHDLQKRLAAGQDVAIDLEIGSAILDRVADGAGGTAGRRIRQAAGEMRRVAASGGTVGVPPRVQHAHPTGAEPWPHGPIVEGVSEALHALLALLDGAVGELVREHDPRRWATRYGRDLEVVVDRERAVFGAWYEFFPRSTGPGGTHGTFEDAEKMLPYVKELGFDVVYLPPIHPIGETKRKGRNNRPEAEEGDVGSPWGIGAEEGGHTAIHPDLGTLSDFLRFRERAEELGLEVALDVAFQASPDHPWVRDHPDWFRHRPDGSIQYAENPPKKYEDIYPLDFESEDWQGLWKALAGVFEHWIRQGVRIFRVDNPHTKALRFWAWCIPALRKRHPDVLFLSEAFTRPRLMYHLAKLGFSQSYTYFTWRHWRWDLTEYLTELTRSEVRHYFRPNFWPNTPDILSETLQTGERPAFMMRLVLAATLSASYGIYGPAFELLEHRPRQPGSEEYLDSEKYQLREWDLERADSLRHFIRRVNRARRDHPALQRNHDLVFHRTDNDTLLAYSKRSPGGTDLILCVVNLDPRHPQAGWTDLDLAALGLGPHEDYQVHDLLSDARYTWRGGRNYVELNPWIVPAHVFHLIRHEGSGEAEDHHG